MKVKFTMLIDKYEKGIKSLKTQKYKDRSDRNRYKSNYLCRK